MTRPGSLRAASILLLLASGSLGGCAGWFGGASPGGPGASAVDATPPLRVQVVAPTELRLLLEKHLDLVRLPLLSRSDTVADLEWLRLIDASPAQVRELLQTEGYFAPTVDVRRGDTPPPGQPREVRIVVTPGRQATISRVTFEVQGELQEQVAAGDARARAVLDDLRRSWSLPAGAPFRNAGWSDAKATALARLRAAGYTNATWSGTAAEIDTTERPPTNARLFLVAESGPLFRAGEIEIEGLEVHDATTVRHLATFGAGTPLTESLLLDYQERLQKSGLFDSVSVTHETDPAHAAAAKVFVKLHEQTLQVYTFGLGYSANTGPRATVEHVHRRLFGRALRSSAKLELGGQRQLLDLEISTHPGESLRRNVVGAVIDRLESSDDVVLSQRLRLGRAYDGRELERLFFVEGERGQRTTSANSSAGSTRTDTMALSGNAHFVLRRLDSVVLPTSGYTLALQTGLGRSHGSNATSGVFGRGYARFTGYLPLGSSWYGQARLEVGQLFRKNGVAAPDSQLWRAGGDDSVRGYGYRDLGPIVGGLVTSGGALFTGSLEIARPFSAQLPSLWGAAFIDAGRAASSFSNYKPAIGTGVGLRWRSPVGPLRIDLAYGEEVRRWRLHFSIGIAL